MAHSNRFPKVGQVIIDESLLNVNSLHTYTYRYVHTQAVSPFARPTDRPTDTTTVSCPDNASQLTVSVCAVRRSLACRRFAADAEVVPPACSVRARKEQRAMAQQSPTSHRKNTQACTNNQHAGRPTGRLCLSFLGQPRVQNYVFFAAARANVPLDTTGPSLSWACDE